MKKVARFLALSMAAAGFGLIWAPGAEAQCETLLKKGASIDVVIQYNNGTQDKATAVVTERDDTYLVFTVTMGKQKVQMPGALMGDTFMVTNSKNHNVWTGKCTADGISGMSSTKGNSGKLSLSVKK